MNKLTILAPAILLSGCAANIDDFNKENNVEFGTSMAFTQDVFDFAKQKSCIDFVTNERKNRLNPDDVTMKCVDDNILIGIGEGDRAIYYKLGLEPSQDSLYERTLTLADGSMPQELSKEDAKFLTQRGYILDPVFNANYKMFSEMYYEHKISEGKLEQLIDMFIADAKRYLIITDEQVSSLKKRARELILSTGDKTKGYSSTFRFAYDSATGDVAASDEYGEHAKQKTLVGIKTAAIESLNQYEFTFCESEGESLKVCSVTGTPFKANFTFDNGDIEAYNTDNAIYLRNLTNNYLEIKYAHVLFKDSYIAVKDTQELKVIPPKAMLLLPNGDHDKTVTVKDRKQKISYGISLLYLKDGLPRSLNEVIMYNPITEREVEPELASAKDSHSKVVKDAKEAMVAAHYKSISSSLGTATEEFARSLKLLKQAKNSNKKKHSSEVDDAL